MLESLKFSTHTRAKSSSSTVWHLHHSYSDNSNNTETDFQMLSLNSSNGSINDMLSKTCRLNSDYSFHKKSLSVMSLWLGKDDGKKSLKLCFLSLEIWE